MAYVTIAATDYDPDSPVTTTLAGAWSNNLAEAFAGNATFKLEDAALDTTVTAAGQSWVAARYVIPALGAIGSYAFLAYTGTDTTISPGETKAGSLSYAGIDQSGAVTYSGAASGTWRAAGYVTGSAGGPLATTWVRIS